MASTETGESTASIVAPAEALHEVIDGQRVESLPMSAYATWIASRLHTRLDLHVDQRSLGTVVMEMLFILEAEGKLRRRPDVAFISSQRWPLDREPPELGDWQVVPNLAVEVVSPNDEFETVLAKVHEYFRHGVEVVWVILPEHRQLYVYDSPTAVRILSESDQLEAGPLLPDFQLPLNTLFRRSE